MGRILLDVHQWTWGGIQSSSVHVTTAHRQLFKMKVVLSLCATLLVYQGAPVPEAEADPFFNTIALPAITGSALVDGLLLGKVAFLKAAILANLLLGSSGGSDELSDSYGAPVDTYVLLLILTVLLKILTVLQLTRTVLPMLDTEPLLPHTILLLLPHTMLQQLHMKTLPLLRRMELLHRQILRTLMELPKLIPCLHMELPPTISRW